MLFFVLPAFNYYFFRLGCLNTFPSERTAMLYFNFVSVHHVHVQGLHELIISYTLQFYKLRSAYLCTVKKSAVRLPAVMGGGGGGA